MKVYNSIIKYLKGQLKNRKKVMQTGGNRAWKKNQKKCCTIC
ncbi:hypothetical protein J2Z42_000150 [Clostridium algifaecis]|uniref:Uncharacterized protein n=1 Tax=Clostridium algifaecis TaxID=1472040 RepID=A0ABS4KN73_9CLOT|nr:hypothetical protein [Clostridium algifaecis]